ncbi:flippase-like domain-containing protein [Candidatus Saccharibacteria bacterium]|nr:flippase-like domain-containing protein [Candidatus Saccharibacteria bacterium]MBI3338271.1 flippase-like domain-containing protein [Candidatus Saccharibacteria bacterium]
MVDKIKQGRWKLALNLFTIGALVILAYALRHQISETIQKLGEVNTYALLLMIPLEIFNYHSQAKLYQSMFRILGDRIRYRSLYRLSLELNFVNNIFPSGGVSGFSYFGVRMKNGANIAPTKATLVQLMKFIMMFVSFQVMLAIGLLMLAIGGNVNNLVILVAGSITTLLFVSTFGLAYIIGSKQRIRSFFTILTRVANRIIHVFRRRHPETINIDKAQEKFTEIHENYMLLKQDLNALKQPLLYSLMANVSEILTIYMVYVAFGHWVNPGAVILGYAIANFAGFFSVLPGGIGLYEALMTATLATAGVSAGLSLPVTIMYRVLNMLIQLPPGYFFYYRTIHKGSNNQSRAVS